MWDFASHMVHNNRIVKNGKNAVRIQFLHLNFMLTSFIMYPLHLGLWLQADARRGQSGPRKPGKAPVSMARSRCKTGRHDAREGE